MNNSFNGFQNQEVLDRITELVESVCEYAHTTMVRYDSNSSIMSVIVEYDDIAFTVNLWEHGGEVVIENASEQAYHDRIILSEEWGPLDTILTLCQMNKDGDFDFVFSETDE